MYLTYRWTMSNERQFSFNRVTLYLIYLFALLPLQGVGDVIRIPNSVASDALPLVDIDIEGMGFAPVEQHQPLWLTVCVVVYLSGVVCTTLRFLFGLVKIAGIIRKGKVAAHVGNFTIIVSPDEKIAPFSCVKYIVVSETDYSADDGSVITHELTHLRARHWVDLVLSNLVAILQWYNPAAWLMIEEFKTIHEYQADDSVIRSGIDIKNYQYMLIEKAVGERLPSPANSLNHSKLKKRITMMYKSKPRALRRVASLATIPALFAGIALVNSPAVASVLSDADNASLFSKAIASEDVAERPAVSDGKVTNYLTDKETIVAEDHDSPLLASAESKPEMAAPSAPSAPDKPAQPASTQEKKKDEVYVAVEQMAEFPGGQSELMKFLFMNVRYPENEKKNKVQGRVIVKFVISKDGKVTDPQVIRGVDPALDAEAIRLVKAMPDWIPGKIDGKPVDSYFNLPITFKIQEDVPADSISVKN